MYDNFVIPLTFVILSVLVLWVVAGSRGWWWLKSIVVTGVALFGILLWHSLSTLEGWPTDDGMPEKFEVKWIIVEEPNRKTKEEGKIYILAKDLSDQEDDSFNLLLHSKEKNNKVRLYSIPYSRKMHEQAEAIQKQIASGKPFYGELKKAEKGKEGEGEGEGEVKQGEMGEGKQGEMGEGKRGGSLSNEQEFILHQLPPPVFIQKNP